METFLAVYAAMGCLGIGIFLADLLGGLFHSGNAGEAESGGEPGMLHDSPAHDMTESMDDAPSAGGHDAASGDPGHLQTSPNATALDSRDVTGQESLVRPGRGMVLVRASGMARNLAYFCLGAGITGVVGLLTGTGVPASLAWSACAGVLVLTVLRIIRRLARQELDSTIRPEEYLMDQALVSVPVFPGQMGKARVVRYGRETEICIRLKDPGDQASRGTLVRIIDVDGDCCTVERETDA